MVCEFTVWIAIVAVTLTVPVAEVVTVDEPMDDTVVVVGSTKDSLSKNEWLILITVIYHT